MDMKKTAKKIAALVAGTTMLGATIMGATALDLSNYPAPFVTDGVFSGKIVVGAKAATSDVVGAIDLAASLQAASTSVKELNVPGAAGTATVVGDSAEFKTGSDILSFGETIGTVKQTFTESDLKALKSGVFSSGSTSTPVRQYLKFDQSTSSVKYAQDDDNLVADFFYVPDSSVIFEYQMEFTEGAASELSGSGANLDDYEGEVMTVLGAPFTVVTAQRPTATANSMKLVMLGGQVADVLRDGETKTYTIDGKDYEVTAVFISSDTTPKAKLSVNGVMTKERAAGTTEVLGSDVTVGIQSILTNQREGMVEFFLGANKLEFTDTNYAGTTYDQTGTVKVNSKSISDGEVIIKATNESATSVKLNYIKYKLVADNEKFIPAGKGVKEYLIKKEGMLTDTWDLTYAGLMKTGDVDVKWKGQSDYGYKFDFENINGVRYVFPLITNRNAVFKYGDDDDDFVFMEPEYTSTTALQGANNETFISDNDYFIVSDRATSATETKAVTSVLRYASISTGDNTLTFNDLSGNDIVVSYSGTLGAEATGELIVEGATHRFYVGANSATASEKYALAMDLNGDAQIGGSDEVQAVVKGGGIIDFGTQTFSLGPLLDNLTNPVVLSALSVNMTITTPASKYDETAEGPETSNISISTAGAGSSATIDITANVDGTSGPGLLTLEERDEYSQQYTDYGVMFELYNPTASNKAGELTIKYPTSQRGAQVFVTAGTVEVKEGTIGEGGKVTSTQLNPIAVGLAVLDTEAPALGSGKMIVVGGPCINTKAAELMGNPTADKCAEGFSPGKAIIKLFNDKNALLVAGYSAQDTLGATYVLSDYKDPKNKLSGTEVEVVVADLNTITINKVE